VRFSKSKGRADFVVEEDEAGEDVVVASYNNMPPLNRD
jgi:hypothetical protein